MVVELYERRRQNEPDLDSAVPRRQNAVARVAVDVIGRDAGVGVSLHVDPIDAVVQDGVRVDLRGGGPPHPDPVAWIVLNRIGRLNSEVVTAGEPDASSRALLDEDPGGGAALDGVVDDVGRAVAKHGDPLVPPTLNRVAVDHRGPAIGDQNGRLAAPGNGESSDGDSRAVMPSLFFYALSEGFFLACPL